MKNSLRVLTILFAFIFIYSCDEENISFEEPINQNSKIKVSYLSKDEVLTNTNLVKELEEINLKRTELRVKNDRDDVSGFEIDYSKVSYIETEKKHSYTFNIKRKIWLEDSFENLVLSSNKEGGYDVVIMKYESDTEKINPFTDEVDVTSLNFTRTSIDFDYSDILTKSGGGECYDCSWTTEWGVVNSGHDNGDLDPDNPDPIYGWVWVLNCVEYSCSDGGGSEDEDGSPFTTDGGNPNNNGEVGIDEGGGGGSNGSGTTTSPTTGTLPSPAWLEDALGIDLTTSQLDYLIDYPNIFEDIKDFLNNNNNTQEAEDLARQAINGLKSYTSSNYPGKVDGFPFKWWEDSNFILNSGNFDMPADAPNAPAEKPNAAELFLFGLFPDEAKTHVLNALEASSTAQTIAANNLFNEANVNKSLNNGKTDAFRHAFWNALGTAEFGATITKLFTDAHEFGQNGIDSQMDIFNNGEGRDLASNYNSSTNHGIIVSVVTQAVLDGTLRYLSPTNINGGIIIGTTQIIPTDQ